ncbi:hypothetical protein AB0469_32020 [Streptomyces sp. NPDC093801]|uniref:hypothetical protein n=1 Tax=Streptomyces sp. NPDC093801 TaxID=3155203 RepID=UPI00344BDB17
MFHGITERTGMRKIFQVTATALLTASALIGTATLASADPEPSVSGDVRQIDVGWGSAPGATPQPTPTATTSDVGWG